MASCEPIKIEQSTKRYVLIYTILLSKEYLLDAYILAVQVKEKLYKFQSMEPSDVEFVSILKSLWGDLAQHIKEEEESDIKALEDALHESDSRSLARSFNRTKKFVPSRSHPSAPNKPPFETVVGLMTAPTDHLADLLKKFPEEAESEMPP